jgi:hypothetical protein
VRLANLEGRKRREVALDVHRLAVGRPCFKLPVRRLFDLSLFLRASQVVVLGCLRSPLELPLGIVPGSGLGKSLVSLVSSPDTHRGTKSRSQTGASGVPLFCVRLGRKKKPGNAGFGKCRQNYSGNSFYRMPLAGALLNRILAEIRAFWQLLKEYQAEPAGSKEAVQTCSSE